MFFNKIGFAFISVCLKHRKDIEITEISNLESIYKIHFFNNILYNTNQLSVGIFKF